MNDQYQDPVQQELAAQLEQAEQAASAAARPAPAAEPTPAAGEPALSPRHTQPGSVFGIQSFFIVVVLAIFVITFIVQAFRVPSGSMENTLLIGDFLLVDKLHFAGEAGNKSMLPYGTVQRGDIVVFYFPVDSSQFLVKRVIGLPGDHVRLRDKAVYVNGQRLQESYAIHGQRAADGYRDNFPAQRDNSHDDIDRRWSYELSHYVNDGEVVVPADQYFVMGDNRDISLDSRYWGFVPRANIVGRPLVIYLSVKGSEADASNDKLIHSGQTLAHLLQLARWDRMFRLVR
jgi:signal peptidase I